MSDGNDVETLRGTLEAAEADCAELRVEVERLRAQANECAALLTERTAQRDGYRAAASEWERLRNEAYRQFREASDERDERAAFAAAETGHANEWSRRAHASEDAYLRVCQALGMAHEPEGHAPSPAPLEEVLTAVRELIDVAGRWQESEGKMDELTELRPRDDWHEDYGAVLWWKVPIAEPPYCGTALDDDFPDYVTHWSPLPPMKISVVEMRR
jgi:hypothetical protein